ncbi:MAG: NADP-dependent malic enzyme [Rhodospirillales bacterium]|jgi:malate dehydrogenase (oxaloacetate-decarboxylating)(NADP+)|nr:NADP-dependent malic enzyme [Rhodospirillaceae bacterium]MDP6430375.1 NADP-dependent malic enzyme [Rhodospirillales bacterium]MDP6646675.1 NADP-dependent malic enzyme [Rhodospirillales bacterium]MDP6841785.1 NADP-dependent malic enzyme [Rhodospirillales bacterium]
MADKLDEEALEYHRYPTPGKVAVVNTKPLANQHDLALAYSPGVAAASELIAENPAEAANLTARGNLVAVVSNGTAVLGLGDIGALASKPVMEGKAGLFKKFAGINVFDIEINETDPEKLVDIVAALEPTFGGINLEDIKAPECFEVESKLVERVNIPVMHDDQHGTAIIVGAGIINALKVVGKEIGEVKLVCSGAGAAALACLDLLVSLGVDKKNIFVSDIAGVLYKGRKEEVNPYNRRYMQKTDARALGDIIAGADIFLGVSAPGVLKPEMVAKMAEKPVIFALANPEPEIRPEAARQVRPDAILATGRTDYPNQVNNVLCFPYIFRGALDVGATTINSEMKMACVHALASLAEAESDETVIQAYGLEELSFGPDYLIPKPFDPRLLVELAPAVAKAAMDTGVAARPIEDFDAYRQKLIDFVFRSGTVMKPVFERAAQNPKRVVFAEGESHRVLRSVQSSVDEGIVQPILIGRRQVIEMRIERLGLRLKIDENFELCDPEHDDRYRDYWTLYHDITQRRGVSRNEARTIVRTNTTVIAALMVRRGEADAMICGARGRYVEHLEPLFNIIGLRKGVDRAAAMSMLIMPKGTIFICDPYVNAGPTAEQIARYTVLAAETIRQFGIQPRAALVSHSNFGSSLASTARKMREAVDMIREMDPDLQVDGEMHADAALSEELREPLIGHGVLKGTANLLIMPSLDAANISFNLVRMLADGVDVGPMLLGLNLPCHVLHETINARGIVDMTALAVVEAQGTKDQELPF